jgi:uncharacterized membrane protein YebE (DUF533 family)
MLDTKALLDQLLSAGQAKGQVPAQRSGAGNLPQGLDQLLGKLGQGSGGLAGGALAGGLMAVLLGTKAGRKMGASAAKIGGLALLGGLAYKAWQGYQQGRPASQTTVPSDPATLPPPQDTAFAEPQIATNADQASMTLIKAMIAAARSDGRIDADEKAKLGEALSNSGLDRDAQTFLFDALGQADDLDAIVAEARTPEFASEIWLAARLAVDADTNEERTFLSDLGNRLKLPPALIEHLEATAVAARDDRPTV